MVTSFKRLLIPILCLMTVSCGGGGGGNDAGGSCSVLNARVFGGDVCSGTAQTPVVAVIAIASNGQQLFEAGSCTGSLVTVDDILTSAHCFVDPIRELGQAIVGFAVVAGGTDGEVFRIVNAAIHPGYDQNPGSPFDVAMATLERVPSPPIGPLPLIRTLQTQAGDLLTTFGYGTNNEGEVGLLKAADVVVDRVEGGNLVSVLATSEASVCPGDSGGPAIKELNGLAVIAGVNSFTTITSQCAATGAQEFGFVNIQNRSIIDFIVNYAPDVTVL